MSTEYTKWTVDRILDTAPIETDKLHVMDVENFMHPDLYAQVQNCIPWNQWQNEELPDNPSWHIHKNINPGYQSKINYSLILNLISVCKSNDPNVIMGLIKNYQTSFNPVELDYINRMISCGINYFNDFIQPTLKFKIPNTEELSILQNVVSEINKIDVTAEADEYQSAIFSVGKNSVFKDDIKSFFKLIYEVVFGQENGPRLGSFIKIYTKDKTIELFNSKLNV